MKLILIILGIALLIWVVTGIIGALMYDKAELKRCHLGAIRKNFWWYLIGAAYGPFSIKYAKEFNRL